MNPFAYLTAHLAIKTVSALSRMNLSVYGKEHIPDGSTIFVINHFTRIETIFLPTRIYQITDKPVWSLASSEFFHGWMGEFLDRVGAVSNKSPDRDRLIVKTLLTGEADWIIYPEGRMVKNKKIFERGRYIISDAAGKRPPHTGAAVLAMRTEFYRERLRWAVSHLPHEAERLARLFELDTIKAALATTTRIVPVNITYYPVRARENILKELARRFSENIDGRLEEEILTEGTMLLSGVDIDIRFGEAIPVTPLLQNRKIRRVIESTGLIGFDDILPCRTQMRKASVRLTDRYMDAIYRMTTVNPDHLFASLIRMMPRRSIDPQDLKRRYYVAVQSLIPGSGVFRHRSLTQDPLNILSDDRFGHFKAFWALARERGAVVREGEIFQKDRDKIGGAKPASPLAWHRSRIDAPLAVMANEVEPLRRLVWRLRRLSLTPSWWIRRRVARHLLQRAEERFESDYRSFFVEGESKPMAIGRPLLMKGRRGRMGILVIHGYMAAPAEVETLARHLAERGFWVYACRLRGHGTSANDLAIRSHLDWVASVDEGYALLSTLCGHTAVCGFSLGGGLALDLAARTGGVMPVAVISPPMRLVDKKSRLAPALDLWNRLMRKANIEEAQRIFVENHPEHPHINYPRNPVAGVKALDAMMDRVADALEKIFSPVLVVQADADPVVEEKGTFKAFEQIGSICKAYLLVHAERHGILLGEGSEMVHRWISGFFETIPEPGTPVKDATNYKGP